ncbi:MAG: helix-turn-helix domain-containing protein [Gemmatimonadota bacterium]|nr:helix-turn-helix domain-containing protein [Gemmatimonadota bacterium]
MQHSEIHAPKVLLTEVEAAATIGFSPRFLQERRMRGGGPPYVRVSARAIRYRPEDLESWAAERLRTSTSDPGREPSE